MATVFLPLLKALLCLAFTSSLFKAQKSHEVAPYFLEIGSLYKIASRIERLVVPVDLTMAVFCKRLHSVHHVRLSNTVRHVVLLEVLLGEDERCVVLAAGAFATAAVFWELVPTRHSQV